GQIFAGQLLVDGQQGLALVQQGFQAVFDVAGGDGLEQVGVRVVFGGGGDGGVGTLGRHHEEQAISAQGTRVTQVLEQLLAVRFGVEVVVAQDQAVSAGFDQAGGILCVRGNVDLGDAQLRQLPPQGCLLHGHVVD